VAVSLGACSGQNAVVTSSNFSGFGAFDRKEFFRDIGEPERFGEVSEIDRSEEFEEVSSDLRPAIDVIRSNLAEAEVGVDEPDVGDCRSEPVESSLEVARTVEVLRRGSCIGGLVTSDSFPLSSFPNLGTDVDGRRRETESLRLLISSRGR